MSYNDKNNNDDMNIKSHLNTSLDLSGISVSEDLINRTLEAIKQQPVNNENGLDTKDAKKKVIPWSRYVRTMAGVAAAVLIIFVGFNFLKDIPNNMSSKKDSSNAEDGNYTGSAMEESQNEMESYATTEDDSMDTASEEMKDNGTEISKSSVVEYTITGKSTIDKNTAATQEAEVDYDVAIEENQIDIDEEKLTDVRLGLVKENEEPQLMTFQSICILAPEQLDSITIKSNSKATTISLTDQIEIINFYTMMEQHSFTVAKDSSIDEYYTVELISPKPEEAFYTIWVGEYVKVRYTQGEETREYTYNPVDYDAFKADLDNFFEERSY